ncbi:MAG: ribosome assembly cofactor RimP [Flavobacteriia bacterium]|nr:MAG: ribosome assembly cofactor RimP [Flavobacteriia bacterium]
MNIQIIEKYIEQVLQERPDLFTVSCKLSAANDIQIEIDGDQGANLDDCMKVSRYIENQLDRDAEDFSLTVTTPDISKPLTLARQYNKNIGRLLQVQTLDGKVEGKLIEVKDDALVLTYKERVPKPIGKGKHTVTKQETISLDNITKATVKIVFNS